MAIRLRNTSQIDKVLWIEPLGDKVLLCSNMLYELSATDDFGKIEIDLCDKGFVIHGWVKRVTALEGNGKELVEWELPD